MNERHHFPIVVHMLLKRGAEVFLLKRSAAQSYGGLYAPPGGYLEPGESLLEAAVRECSEETGVQVSQADLVALLSFRSSNQTASGSQGLNCVFVATHFEGEPQLQEAHHFSAGGFFPLLDLPADSVPWLADACAAADRQGAAGAQLIEYVWDQD